MNIHDIARFCGVSVATVSRVLNDSPHVSAKTRAKVLGVMEEKGYTPNAFARGLGLNTMRMVGIVCRDVANYFYGRAVSLLEHSLREKGYDTLLCCTGTALEDKQKSMRLLLEKRVDAILLVGSTFREKRDNSHIAATAAQVPVFMVNASVSLPGVYCVLCDEAGAMADNVRSLAAAGCRRILYLHDMAGWAFAGSQKLNGYRAGLRAAGLVEDPALVQVVGHGVASAQECVQTLLEQDIPFDAVLGSEDTLVIGAQKALAARELQLPMIGFNNSQFATIVSPALTSVDNMLDTICPTSVDLLDKLLAGQQVPQKTVVSASLVERETFRRLTPQ